MQTLSRSAGSGSVLVNTFALAGVCAILIFAFAWQFVFDELPCPLCLLQRVAFIMAGVGLLLNVRFGPSSLHYSAVLIAALGGLAASGRQVLLHAAPGDPGYGSPFLGLHFYTWAFIAFAGLLVYCGAMLAIDRKWGDNVIPRPASLFGGLVMWLFLIATLANVVMVVLECGFGACPDNPVSYLWLKP